MKHSTLCIISILGFLLAVQGCEPPGPLSGNWYQEDYFRMEFDDDGTFASETIFKKDSIVHHHGKWTMHGDTFEFRYEDMPHHLKFLHGMKDSILWLKLFSTNGKAPEGEQDTSFYHRRKGLYEYHIKQLYKYGEVRDTAKSEHPFIYFQF